MSVLEEIRARDAEVHRCLTCGGYPGGAHDSTVEECEANLIAQSEANGSDWHKRQYVFYPVQSTEEMAERAKTLGPKWLCWGAEDHHPYVEDVELKTVYEDAERDRRTLLRIIDRFFTSHNLPRSSFQVPEEEL
jgi:hypothetical protein